MKRKHYKAPAKPYAVVGVSEDAFPPRAPHVWHTKARAIEQAAHSADRFPEGGPYVVIEYRRATR